MFLEGGVVGIGIVVWYRGCRLVRVRDIYLSFGTRSSFGTRLDVYLRL